MLYESFLADGIPSFRKLFQFGWRLYGGFDQTLHRTRNMTKKDGEIFRDIGRTLHRIRREAADGWGFLLSVELNSPTNLVTVENGWRVLLKQAFHSPSNLATTGNSWRVLPKQAFHSPSNLATTENSWRVLPEQVFTAHRI